MAKHTAGVWSVYKYTTPKGLVQTIVTTTGANICRVDIAGRKGNPDADANLIAAAPEMYEALRAAIEEFYWLQNYVEGSHERNLYQQMKAALTKAEGG